jgi:hypothetical protein
MSVVVVISQHLLNVFVQLANKRRLKKKSLDVEAYSLCLLLLCSVDSTGAADVGMGCPTVDGRGVAQQTIGIRASNPHIEGRFPVLISSLAAWHFSIFVQIPSEPPRVVQGSPVNKPNSTHFNIQFKH